MNSILVIQTAFIGDVVLATAALEKLHQFYPTAKIDMLIRKGNEGLLENHPFINDLLIWNKKESKYKNLSAIIKQVRSSKYDAVFNLQRFAASGLVTFLSGAKYKAGFDKNPFSFSYNHKVNHQIGNGKHEIERNQEVLEPKTTKTKALPQLYPSASDFEKVTKYQENEYVVLAPASVWYTKQLPQNKWVELIKTLNPKLNVYLIGGPGDIEYCKGITKDLFGNKIEILAGKLSFLESAALMKGAKMNYVNDSAPLHIAGAVKAPVTAIFCSTIPSFGFGPILPNGKIAEIGTDLDCRPCGLHGLRECPKGHFKCATDINMKSVAV
ncbi:MAG: glycosyltransferase family 9 protein [Salibacteraceae bacterium]